MNTKLSIARFESRQLTPCFPDLQLDLQLQDDAGGDVSSFITNGEWDLLGKVLLSTRAEIN